MPRRPRSAQQLPPGRHGLPAAYVAQHQRHRLLAGVVATVAELGYDATTVEHVVQAAGVSRRTFYDAFANKEAAFVAAYDDIVDRLLGTVHRAYASAAGDPAARVEVGAAVFLEFLARDPDVAHVYVVDILAAGPTALARRTVALERFRAFLMPSAPPDDARFVPPRAAQAAIGAAHELIFTGLQTGDGRDLGLLLPDVIHALLLPFAGPDRAEQAYRAAAERRPVDA